MCAYRCDIAVVAKRVAAAARNAVPSQRLAWPPLLIAWCAIALALALAGGARAEPVSVARICSDLDATLEKPAGVVIGPALLRAPFHDCSAKSLSDPESGCNGSLMFELHRHENNQQAFKSSLTEHLKPLQQKYVDAGEECTMADLIAVAGACVVKKFGGPMCDVQLGRRDRGSADPEGELPERTDKVDEFVKNFNSKFGMSKCEIVALIGGGHSLGRHDLGIATVKQILMHPDAFGMPFDTTEHKFDTRFFNVLQGQVQRSGNGPRAVPLQSDMSMMHDEETKECVLRFASDKDAFFQTFCDAFLKLTKPEDEE